MGTRDSVELKDSELGLIRLSLFGIFKVQVVQVVLFINRLSGRTIFILPTWLVYIPFRDKTQEQVQGEFDLAQDKIQL